MKHNFSEIVFLLRSIQKLEEMNVGIDHRADEVTTTQWNGLTENTSSTQSTAAQHTPDTGPPTNKPGKRDSSTPLRTGGHGLPSLGESPVPTSQR